MHVNAIVGSKTIPTKSVFRTQLRRPVTRICQCSCQSAFRERPLPTVNAVIWTRPLATKDLLCHLLERVRACFVSHGALWVEVEVAVVHHQMHRFAVVPSGRPGLHVCVSGDVDPVKPQPWSVHPHVVPASTIFFQHHLFVELAAVSLPGNQAARAPDGLRASDAPPLSAAARRPSHVLRRHPEKHLQEHLLGKNFLDGRQLLGGLEQQGTAQEPFVVHLKPSANRHVQLYTLRIFEDGQRRILGTNIRHFKRCEPSWQCELDPHQTPRFWLN
mmetsp:Transcript_20682/g.39306  ORF Transcript_20682/g.39306 Transcript_20682/m.39306 type:complete len:273 (-) Transcript_20682:157-975(-)